MALPDEYSCSPVKVRLWPGRSLRGVMTGTPIWDTSTLLWLIAWWKPAPETEERRERDGW
jgi:hypothetical protein